MNDELHDDDCELFHNLAMDAKCSCKLRLAKLDELRARVDRLEKLLAESSIDAAYLKCLLRQSTEELEAVLQSGTNIARNDIENQIAANEAALGGKHDTDQK